MYLTKVGDGFFLYEDDGKQIGTTKDAKYFFKLSEENCEEVFYAIDSNKIRVDYIDYLLRGCDDETRDQYYIFAQDDAETYLKGVKQGLRIAREKESPLIAKLIEFGKKLGYTQHALDNILKPSEKIPVEIILSGPLGISDKYTPTPEKSYKMDENGRIILKRK